MEKKRIMVIDDEKDFLLLMKLNLEHTGIYEVMTLSDASDILTHVNSFKPNLILLDILMPKVDGVDVCNMLNDDPCGRGIPIITLSALGTEKDKLMMYKLGVIDFLVKPISTENLLAKVAKALQLK